MLRLKRVAQRVIAIQLGIGSASALAWTLFGSVQFGLAALVGMLISVFMTFYVAARWSLRSATIDDTREILGAFYRAQMMKLLIGTGLIFVAVYAFREHAAALVITLALTLAAYGFALLGDID